MSTGAQQNDAAGAERDARAHDAPGTSVEGLAAHIAALSDVDVAALLAARPDLTTPPSASFTALAARAGARPSVEAALARLDAPTLAVAEAVVALGALKTTVSLSRLQLATKGEAGRLKRQQHQQPIQPQASSIIDQIHQKRLHFRHELDVRGFRAGEALDAVGYYVDEALQLGVGQVRILHGTGTGALREAIRSYLRGVRGVADFHDEDVRFGGAGITVVHME